MKIGVLQADRVLAQLQPRYGDYPQMFQAMLIAAGDNNVTVAHYDVQQGQYPEHIDECDGYLITGSRSSVYDDEAWIQALARYVVELDAARKKLVGICFGHQVVAQALGGRTEAAQVGWGIGVHSSRVLAKKPFMKPALEHIGVIVSHKDQVTQLPERAELLASSAFCPNSMFMLDDHILTFQGHPEFTKELSKDLMEIRQQLLGEPVFSEGMASLGRDIHTDILARWIVQFIAG